MNRLRAGMVWHPADVQARDLAWILDAADDAAWVWFPSRQQLWFYPPGGGWESETRGFVMAELVTDPGARQTILRLIQEDDLDMPPISITKTRLPGDDDDS